MEERETLKNLLKVLENCWGRRPPFIVLQNMAVGGSFTTPTGTTADGPVVPAGPFDPPQRAAGKLNKELPGSSTGTTAVGPVVPAVLPV
jgi:hypothetical protein